MDVPPKQALREKLLPTQTTFIQHSKKVNFQAMVWALDEQQYPKLPSLVDHGWHFIDGQLVPVVCGLPCATAALKHRKGEDDDYERFPKTNNNSNYRALQLCPRICTVIFITSYQIQTLAQALGNQ